MGSWNENKSALWKFSLQKLIKVLPNARNIQRIDFDAPLSLWHYSSRILKNQKLHAENKAIDTLMQYSLIRIRKRSDTHCSVHLHKVISMEKKSGFRVSDESSLCSLCGNGYHSDSTSTTSSRTNERTGINVWNSGVTWISSNVEEKENGENNLFIAPARRAGTGWAACRKIHVIPLHR